MKLLFDENLSPKLVDRLADLFPDSAHVDRLGLGSASDETIWHYAQQHGFTLVSKDSDFHERSVLQGHPPKVIWIRRGNCSTRQLEELLRANREQIQHLENEPGLAFILLF
jgi:predicted nuclease of predicted toxin-antitoxin system